MLPWNRLYLDAPTPRALRMSSIRSCRAIAAVLLAALGSGCQRSAAPPPAAPPQAVPVSHPLRRNVTEYIDYTGRTDAVDSVGIKARVTGYLVSSPFREGAEVEKDTVLFEIDPRPYQAQLNQAEAQVALAEAQARLAKANYERFRTTGSGASAAELDQAKATAEASEAQLNSARATAEVYRLNLGYTKVRSPIKGQVSRIYFTVGNLVNQDQTLLTTVVSTDKMYAYFDVDERTDQRITRLIGQGKIPARGTDMPVLMGLESEEGYPHKGTINFSNNVLNASTATRSYRGLFENPKPENGRRLLSPGMFLRVRLPLGAEYPATLVVDRAIGSGQGLKFVYVLDAEKKVRYRRIRTGPLQDDGLRVVEEGLAPEELVVVGAIQQLRPGQDVVPEVVPMPIPGAAAPAPPKPEPKS
jgi:RND family efflux transporter MFP subunit